jgi:fructokinase
MGAKGVLVACNNGVKYKVSPAETRVADITGAGDAFWTGYLAAWLEGASQIEAAQLGQVMAALKVSVVGPIRQMPAIDELTEQARHVPYIRM